MEDKADGHVSSEKKEGRTNGKEERKEQKKEVSIFSRADFVFALPTLPPGNYGWDPGKV